MESKNQSPVGIFSEEDWSKKESSQTKTLRQTKKLLKLQRLISELKGNSNIQYLYNVGDIKYNEPSALKKQINIKNSGKFIQCKICGWYSTNTLVQHISYKHNSVEEYENKFGSESVMTKEWSNKIQDKMKGSSNPSYNHGGTNSPYSKKFKKYENLSEDEREKSLQKVYRKNTKTRDDNNNSITRLSYYLKRGYTEEESKIALKERQATFTLEKCIKKYGKEEGLKRWHDRQLKWLATLNNKTDEEKSEINRGRISGLGPNKSKNELDLLNEIRKIHSDAEGQFKVRLDGKRWLSFDIKVNDALIEYHGDYWHANPEKYEDDDIITYPGNIKTSAKERRKRDEIKRKVALENGYKYLVIWESEYKKDKNGTINWLMTQIR